MFFLNIHILWRRSPFLCEVAQCGPNSPELLECFHFSNMIYTKKRFLHSYTSKLLHKYSVTIFLLMIKNILRFLSWTHEQQYLYSSECCFIFATHSVLSTCSLRGSLCNIYARLKVEWTTKPLLWRKWR